MAIAFSATSNASRRFNCSGVRAVENKILKPKALSIRGLDLSAAFFSRRIWEQTTLKNYLLRLVSHRSKPWSLLQTAKRNLAFLAIVVLSPAFSSLEITLARDRQANSRAKQSQMENPKSERVQHREKNVRMLEPGTVVERELAGDETHTYKIRLLSGQYVHIVLNQNGIDVVIALYGSNGKKISEMDMWSDTQGPEMISHIARDSGTYRLVVRSSEKKAPSGRYDLKIAELRLSTQQDFNRIAAERAYTRGDALFDEGTAASRLKAANTLEHSLALWRELDDSLWKATTLLYIGLIQYEFGNIEKALDYYNEALPLWHATGERSGEAATLSSLGRAYDSFGEYQKAIDYYDLALPLSEAVKARGWQAYTLHNLGMAYTSLAEYQAALSYFEMALELSRETKDRTGVAHTLHHMGEVCILMGTRQCQSARKYLDEALQLSRAEEDTLGEATTLNHLGKLFVLLGDKKKALDDYHQALRLRRAFAYRVGEAQVLNNIAAVYVSENQYQKARQYYDRALLLRQAVGDQRGQAETLYGIANVESNQGNLNKARSHIEAALSIVERLRAKVVNPEVRASYFSTAQDYFDFYIDLLFQLHKKYPSKGFEDYALQASERARARSLLDLLREGQANIRKGVNPDLLERERSLQRLLNARSEARTQLLSSPHTVEQATTAAKEIETLTTEYQKLEAKIRQVSPRYAALTQPEPLSLKEIQQTLDSDTLLLEYWLGEERSYLWLVSLNKIKSYELPSRKSIEAVAHNFHNLLISVTEVNDLEMLRIASRLSQMLLEQVASELDQKRLVIVADGALQYIPFAALSDPRPIRQGATKTAQPLIAHHEIVSLPSISVLATLRSETVGRMSAPKDIVVLADPVFDSGDQRVKTLSTQKRTDQQSVAAPRTNTPDQQLKWQTRKLMPKREGEELSRLPGTRKEAEEIVAFVPAGRSRQALDFDASRELVLSGELSQYRYVHFATHALVDGDYPELTSIVLSLVDENGNPRDGFLRAHEVYNLHLQADLVVLSACKTALGKEKRGEGLISLTRGFMYAGTPRIVASLWRVDDDSPAELMKTFYREMIMEEKRPAEALRAAQLEMLKTERWGAPRYWAAFVLQGDWK